MKSNKFNTVGHDSFVIIMDWVCEVILSLGLLVLFGSCSGQNLTLVGWCPVSKHSQASATPETISKLLSTSKTLLSRWLWCFQSSRRFLTQRFQFCHSTIMATDRPWSTPTVMLLNSPLRVCQRPPAWTVMDRGRFLFMQTQQSSAHHHGCYNRLARAYHVVARITSVSSAPMHVGHMEHI